jgi:hypothetical protein
MKLRWERVSAETIDPEFLWGSVLAGCGLLAAAWSWAQLPTPQCPFYQLSGFPCFSCGGTRSLRTLVSGNVEEALAWNPLVVLLGVGSFLFVIYAAVVVFGNLPRLRLREVSSKEANFLRLLVVSVVIINWGFLWASGRL